MRCFENAEKKKKKERKKCIWIAPGVWYDRQVTADKATDVGLFPFKTNIFICYASKTRKFFLKKNEKSGSESHLVSDMTDKTDRCWIIPIKKGRRALFWICNCRRWQQQFALENNFTTISFLKLIFKYGNELLLLITIQLLLLHL